ncbi:hypothetical protein [Chryseobacterium rhizosphaerae]|uniref:hypothetical protein n=1 Tax=Chryseobacterium rhizosphaerae TaxID=395937 RepID=UPI0023597F5A|nr:hypothetical protein [Chryseobacterium rhizosphaerae]MDC8099633.1 hypothetical protein [Chryseobacterium rhizosphaerae]
METIIYENLEDFKENYIIDFSIQSEYNLLQYLSMLKKKYNSHTEECRALYDKSDTTTFKIIETLADLEDYMPYHAHFILKNNLLEDFNPSAYNEDNFILSPELLGNCLDLGDGSKAQNKTLYEKISIFFSLKKQADIRDREFYRKANGLYEIIQYITDQIEMEKNILLRFRDMPRTENTGENIDLDSWTLFHTIRYNDIGYLERSKYLKDITENYHPDLLHSLLKDLEFYLFIEKDEKEAEFDSEEIEQAIKEREAKKLPIPYLKRTPEHLLTEKQKEMREAHRQETGGTEALCIDLESLLFPYEFFSLYEFQRLIIRKIKELSPEASENDIDISEFKTTKTKSIALLHHTGILEFLRIKYPTISDRQLAGFFEFLTREPITARNQSSQFTTDKNSVKYPIKNKKDLEELDRLLVSFGIKERRIS